MRKHSNPSPAYNRIHIAMLTLCLVILVTGCGVFNDSSAPSSGTPIEKTVSLRFAVFGDAEPKPTPSFIHLSEAVDTVNQLNQNLNIAFVASVGDIAHRGTHEQYKAATEQIRRLNVPFFAIMGNEEFEAGVSRFLHYAEQWNDTPGLIPHPSFTHKQNGVHFVFASASIGGSEFSDADIDWMLGAFDDANGQPIVLFIHPPAAGVFPDAEPQRTAQNERFEEVLAHPKLSAVFSGHLHLNLDRSIYHVTRNGVQHIHVPGLERTKVPANSPHSPYFFLITVFDDGTMLVEAYDLIARAFHERHQFLFEH